MKTKYALLTIALVLTSLTAASQGLGFSGMEHQIDERTHCSFFGGGHKRFCEEASVSFLFSPQLVNCSGNILRITDPNEDSFIWNVSFYGGGNEVVIRVNEEGRSTLIFGHIPREEMTEMTWTEMSVLLDFKRDSVKLCVGPREWRSHYDFDRESRRLTIDFGRSGHMTDVAPFAIRDLRISDKRKTYEFPLNEVRGQVVHDSAHQTRGIVENPTWMMNESLEWTRLAERRSATNGGSVYDVRTRRVYLYDEEGLWAYDAITKKSSFSKYANPCPLTLEQGLCYLSGGSLIAYETRMDMPQNPQRAARLDLGSCSWTESWEAPLSSSRFHHASFMNPMDGKYTIFGGYGFTTYSGEFLKFNETCGCWEETWSEIKGEIMPRYFTSAGVDPGNEYVYIFGGMGNDCGEAIVGRKYIYDLYRVRLSDGSVEKMWEIKLPETEIVPGRNLVVTDRHIYAACYPEYNTESEILLYRFAIEDGETETFGNPVPINSDKIGTNANLYLDPAIKKLFLITKVSPGQKETVLDIYSMNFPPLSPDSANSGVFPLLILLEILAGLAALALMTTTVLFLRKRRLSRLYSTTKANPEAKSFRSSNLPNTIYTFGEIQVNDRNGNDITGTFYSQSLLLLALLIKYRGHGLSARRMTAVFWPDKEEEKARNSRGVAINTLRKKLQELDGVSISFHDKHYYLEVEAPASVDCFFVKDELDSPEPDRESILCALSRGRFLFMMNDPSLDKFKAESEETCINFLEGELKRYYAKSDWLAAIEIADMLFCYDVLSEAALSYKIFALRKIGRDEEAKETFSAFASEFRRSSGEQLAFGYKSVPKPENLITS